MGGGGGGSDGGGAVTMTTATLIVVPQAAFLAEAHLGIPPHANAAPPFGSRGGEVEAGAPEVKAVMGPADGPGTGLAVKARYVGGGGGDGGEGNGEDSDDGNASSRCAFVEAAQKLQLVVEVVTAMHLAPATLTPF